MSAAGDRGAADLPSRLAAGGVLRGPDRRRSVRRPRWRFALGLFVAFAAFAALLLEFRA